MGKKGKMEKKGRDKEGKRKRRKGKDGEKKGKGEKGRGRRREVGKANLEFNKYKSATPKYYGETDSHKHL